MELSVTPEWRGCARARVWGARARHERGAADGIAGGVRSNATLDSTLSLVSQTSRALDRGSPSNAHKAWKDKSNMRKPLQGGAVDNEAHGCCDRINTVMRHTHTCASLFSTKMALYKVC
jgi:hypothetical protein